MKIRFLFLMVLFTNFLFSQLPCPLKTGEIIPSILRCLGSGDDKSLNRIKSDNNQVFSLSEGKVVNILLHSDNSKTLLVRTVDDYFYTYSNLDKVFFKPQDKIEKDALLGFALFDEDEKKYLVEFQYWKKTERLKVELNCKKPD
ncbi:M23 family metallopeptidase [Chryseobacterium formosus]|uniref:M23 family metallopeptidase n=1 Tax=Chryseobacterium formosus TaxID=1537363 RepID=A0ABT3XQD7_9FLAO|nr:hypothetical protein [Chryseobacterium formosus]MCX8523742.1 M23 family metallopeptidase [Chryseobacterium formosus]